MKTRKLTSAALALVLTAVMAFGLAAPVRAMDFGLSGLDASLAAQSFQQQVELSVNLAALQAEAAQSSAQWQAESSLASLQQLEAAQNTPVVSEGGNLNGGLGDPNTIIVQGGTPIVGSGSTIYPGETVRLNRGTVEENQGTVQDNDNDGTVLWNMQGGTVEINKGTVQENRGTVLFNMQSGTVQRNMENGTVHNNYGTVQNNNGTVRKNIGTVQDNDGTVQDNNGTVQYNLGTVQTNTEAGTVTRNTGTVAENSGTVDNYTNGIVTLNKEGGIVFNYGGSITENLGIELFQVTISRNANTSVTDATDGLTAHNGEAWKEKGDISGQTATVTISPAAGYTITNIAAAEGISPVRNADGTWTVTVDASLVNANEFTLDTTVAQNTGSYPPFNYEGGENPDPYFSDILSLLNITLEPAPAVYDALPNAYDSFNEARIAELSAAAKNGTVTIDLRETGWTTLKREVFEAAAKRGDVTIIILYTHWGQDCTLTIPAGTDFSALFEAQFLEVSQLPALLHLSAV